MRCKAAAAGVGFLLSPVRLQHRHACYALPRSIAWCSQPCSGVEKTRWWLEPPRCEGTHDECAAGASTPAVAFAAMGVPASRRRLRRIGRGIPMAAVHRRSQARGLGSISDDEAPMTTPSASSATAAAAAVAAAARTTAVVLELERGVRDANTLAVYGKLHRVLGATRSRRLLGANAVATLTSSNYLVLHHRDGGPSAYLEDFEESGSGGARLALGDRCWDICGIGQRVSLGKIRATQIKVAQGTVPRYYPVIIIMHQIQHSPCNTAAAGPIMHRSKAVHHSTYQNVTIVGSA